MNKEITPLWLSPCQKRLVIVAGAIAGATAALLVVKWLDGRRLAREAAAKPGSGLES